MTSENRNLICAMQAMRQTGSSFKVYVYAEALDQGASPFDTVVDAPVSFHSGGQLYSPHNYDEKFEGRITAPPCLGPIHATFRLFGSLTKWESRMSLAWQCGNSGIRSPLPPYLPLALGAADLTLMEHTSAFTVFPNDGIHIEPHYIRRVTSYDGSVLEEPYGRSSRTRFLPMWLEPWSPCLKKSFSLGPAFERNELGRRFGGKTGTTNDFTDAWYIGFTPQLTAGVWVGNDDKRRFAR